MDGWDTLMATLAVGVAVLDTDGSVVKANPSCAALLGLTEADLLGGTRPIGWEMRDDTGSRVPRLADLAAQVTRCDGSLTLAMEAGVPGTTHRLWADLHPVGGQRVALLVRPVEAEPARATGLLDPVTGLPGRVLLFDRLGQALARRAPVSLVLAGVHGLGVVNERFGFAGGDLLLGTVAARLRGGLDATVARYACRTFAVLGTGDAEELAARTMALAAAPVQIGGEQVCPALRVGWAARAATVHTMVSAAEDMLRA